MSDHKTELLGKLASRTATVGVIGLGYVGLPLALVFEEAGFPVLGFDVDAKKPEALHRGESYIRHIGPGRLLPPCGVPYRQRSKPRQRGRDRSVLYELSRHREYPEANRTTYSCAKPREQDGGSPKRTVYANVRRLVPERVAQGREG